MNSSGKHTGKKYFIKLLRACAVVNSILIGLLCIGMSIVAWMTADDGSRSFDPSIMTAKLICSEHLLAPMPQEVTNDLCDKNLVPENVADCSITPPQLQRDDTEAIITGNIQIGISTHQSVKEAFGKYETSCREIYQLKNLYLCDYNLSGEGPIITISYDASTQIVITFYSLLTGC